MNTHTPRNILVTGGCGFIGSNFVPIALRLWPEAVIINLDALTYAGNQASLREVEEQFPERYTFVKGDIADSEAVRSIFTEHNIDTVVHFAAESHVDRSIDGPAAFVHTNIVGTQVLLEEARAAWGARTDVRFHHVSTDEVFGSLGKTGFFDETTAYDPSSPYSASKAGADHLVRAWNRTFGLRMTLSNCSNNYGPFQFPEKLIPLMILKALRFEALPVYGDGLNVRDWLHVHDHCEAICAIITGAEDGSTWCIGGHNEWANLHIVHAICDNLDAQHPAETSRRDCITFVTDRPGHDRRYAIDASKIEKELGWSPRYTFESGIKETIDWYLTHDDWLVEVSGGTSAGNRLGVAE